MYIKITPIRKAIIKKIPQKICIGKKVKIMKPLCTAGENGKL